MEFKINLENTVAAALEQALSPDRIRTQVDEAVTKVVDGAIREAFSSYGDFGKTVKAAVATLVPHELSIDGAANFNDAIVKMIASRVNALQDERMKKAVLEPIEELLKPAPTEIKLSELIDKMIQSWGSHWSREGAERPTIIVEKSDTVAASDYWHIFLHPKKVSSYGNEKYNCRTRLDVTGSGEVYNLVVDQTDVKNRLFVGPMYGFEQYLFHLYTGKTKLIIDRTDFEDVCYSDSDSDED